ncbi:MAG: tRNA (adenosine(37)-N6)-dimethylallyltransferase MiaA [Dehalococcoidia bacterium]|nr:tRNA (adenosine(37)-N6)-dimethylallyltransferase MiaA [Dehalococcoidia bacterium]
MLKAQQQHGDGETRPPLIAIVGPTAVGKTAASIRLASRLNGEIVSADSRQVYRYMDIGTAKPIIEERAAIPHHIIDVAEPDQPYNVALFSDDATAAVQAILSHGKTPLMVGGSGLYVKAIISGLALPNVAPDPAFRSELEALAAREGNDAVWQELNTVDPHAAQSVGHHNLRRMIRALEVWRLTGIPFSQQSRAKPPPWDITVIGLTMERHELYRRIDERVDRMIESGLFEETKSLVEMGYSWDLPSMSGLGYKQVGEYLRGESSIEDAVQKIKHQTHRYVRQQYTWFSLNDPKIQWFDASKEGIIDAVYDYLFQRLNQNA